MNEDDLTEGLRDVMERSTPPPAMDSGQALERGRTVRRRRRIAWSGLAVVPVVAAVAVGPTLVSSLSGGAPGGGLVAAGPAAAASKPTAQPKPVSSAPPVASTTRKSGDPWPEGQTDRTATAGPRLVRVTKLMDDLSASVPAGFTTPDVKSPEGYRLRYAQAQYASNDGEPDYWQYAAIVPVEKAGRVGRLLMNSTTADGRPAKEPCKLAKEFWGSKGTCAVEVVDGKKVGVVTSKSGSEFDQSATYRHDDGTVVILAQSKALQNQPKPPLTQPIFTGRQLAELVTDAKFDVAK
ncbi:hypothetical protein ACI2LF_29450 [Kribbella sp. NPDC020789]